MHKDFVASSLPQRHTGSAAEFKKQLLSCAFRPLRSLQEAGMSDGRLSRDSGSFKLILPLVIQFPLLTTQSVVARLLSPEV